MKVTGGSYIEWGEERLAERSISPTLKDVNISFNHSVMSWPRDPDTWPLIWSAHMILKRDHSHDLLTWSRHVTYELHPDIKSSLIPSSASSLPCHDYIRVPHSSYDYYIFSASQHATSPDSVVVAWEGFTSIAINESYWREPRRLL